MEGSEIPIGLLLLLIMLIVLSGFFSMSETALVSSSKLRIRRMRTEGVRGAKKLDILTDDMDTLLSTLLVGNNVVNIATSSIATYIAMSMFGNAGVGLATGIVTLLILIFGEITPKSMAQRDPERIALRTAPVFFVLVRVLRPITFLLTKLTGGIVRMLGHGQSERPQVTEEDMKTMASVGAEEGIIEDGEKDVIHNAFKLSDLRVGDVCVHRTDMVTIHVDASAEEVLRVIREERFSRFPVHGDNVDDIRGILHIKDVLLQKDDRSFNVAALMRKPYFAFEQKHIGYLMEEMRRENQGMAIILDEYGGVEGLATMSDIIAEIFGDMEDEYAHDEEHLALRIDRQTWLLEGSLEIEDVEKIVGRSLPEGEYDTLGGMILDQLPALPGPEDRPSVTIDDMVFCVLSVAGRKIDRIRAVIPVQEDEDEQ